MNKIFFFYLLKKIIPPFLFNFFLTFLINLNFFFFINDNVFKKNNIFKNKAKNKKEGVLIATGPSIKNQNLKKLKKFDCFSISSFFFS